MIFYIHRVSSNSSLPYSFPAGFGAGTPQQEHVCAAKWRGLAPTSSCGGTTRNDKQAKAGYHHYGGTLPFALHPLYCTFRVNRCVRPYTVRTHVRRKKGRFLHIGIFFRLSVWYTRFSSTNRNLRWKYGIKQGILRVYFRAAI